METNAFLHSLQSHLGNALPSIVGAIALFVAGYVVATLLQVLVRKVLSNLKLNVRLDSVNKQTGATGKLMDVEHLLAAIVFWFVILLTAIGVLNILNIEQLSMPLSTVAGQILGYLPSLLSGVLLLLLAYLLATLARFSVAKMLKITRIDDQQWQGSGVGMLQENIGGLVFWVVILLFLPVILSAFQINALLAPVQNMLDKILLFMPNVLAAGVTLLVGWVVARVLSNLVSGMLVNMGANECGSKINLQINIAGLIGNVIFILILLPVFVTALNALQIESVSGPASKMLEMVLLALPNVVSAVLILILTYFIARIVAELLTQLVASAGLDQIFADVSVKAAFKNDFKLSVLLGRLLMFFAMLFATSEAAHRLNFVTVQELLTQFIHFGGKVMLGMVILIIGVWLSGIVRQMILSSNGEDSVFMANLARVAVLVLVTAMGLSAMGIADAVINITLSLLIGAIAVAFALAFGLGGREEAAKQVEHWFAKLRNK